MFLVVISGVDIEVIYDLCLLFEVIESHVIG